MNNNLWEKTLELHGHECMGVALGFRLGEEAKRIFGDAQEIQCILPGRSCICDGITGSTGASEENGRIHIDSSVEKFVFYIPEDEEGWAFTYKKMDLQSSENSVEWILKGNRDLLFVLEPWERKENL